MEYSNLKLFIFEACLENMINVEERDLLLFKLDDEYEEYTESLKEDIKTVIKNPKSEESKKILTKAADKYNEGMNKRATAVANKIVKDPTHGGVDKVSEEVYEQYKKDMLKWRTAYKVGEILATGAIAIGPIDTVIKIATATAMARSDDPVDKATLELLKSLKEKAMAIKDKLASLVKRVKDKAIDAKGLDSEINSLDTATAATAKATDTAKKKLKLLKGVPGTTGTKFRVKKTAMAAVESTYEKIDEFLEACGEENKYEALNMVIERSDFDEVDILPLVFTYCGITNE